eukprot:TRINITY_DN2727_c0_g1_i2.p1 TRINITY_DN2727_c0_g1~~TRINITY_DN2727_c0_g1_i2.p1  ORF type:complete len:219 (-),score=25.26 TRINITY_DN2727_c0_g1_i2:94-729(-)
MLRLRRRPPPGRRMSSFLSFILCCLVTLGGLRAAPTSLFIAGILNGALSTQYRMTNVGILDLSNPSVATGFPPCDTTVFPSPCSGPLGEVSDMAVVADGIFFVGTFVQLQLYSPNSTPLSGKIARFNFTTQSWIPMCPGICHSGGGGGSLIALAVTYPYVWIGGEFTTWNAQPSQGIVRYDISTDTYTAVPPSGTVGAQFSASKITVRQSQ